MQAGLLVLAAALPLAAGDQPLNQVLSRVSEEAEVFRLTAPRLLAQEKLVQRTIKPPRRFRPRVGAGALAPPKPQYRTREVISEYAFGNFKESPGVLHEFRQVMSVDGRQLANIDKARETLTAGAHSADDRVKKRLLEKFEKYGLSGAAADFGQVLLLFTRQRLPDYTFTEERDGQVGADRARVLAFKQKSGSESLVIFRGRKALHQPLEGQLWVRADDSMPLRVVLTTSRMESGKSYTDEATVDYVLTPHGYVAPISVVHRGSIGSDVVVENTCEYTAFQVFKADAEVQFKGEAPLHK